MTPLFLVLLLLLPSASYAQRPPAVVPDNPRTVLERLPRGYTALALAASGSQPSIGHVQMLQSTAASTGDTRLATRAEGLLARFPEDTSDTRVLKARAFSAQHRHDFAGALRLLDKAVTLSPRDGDARMARAQIHLVQGRIDRAREDCATVTLNIDLSRGMLCVAAISTRTGNIDQAIVFLDRWLGQGGMAAQDGQDPELHRHVLLMRAEAAAEVGADDADAWFEQALEASPGDVRSLVSYSRHLRASGRPAQALELLADAPPSDGLQLQRALASHAAGAPEAAALALAQKRRYETAYAAGSEPELRDEAEFLLTLQGDSTGALKLALRNFQQQRDREDVEILRRAAFAAGAPDALAPLAGWAKSQNVQLPPMRKP